jgi:Domain of unknown function (DU1801)
MTQRNEKVDAHLAASEHPRKEEVQRLRLAILAADPEITESVKWNAPNFRFAGTDEFRFDDPTGMLEWAAPDGGVLTDADAGDAAVREAAIVELVRRWVRS